MRKHLPTIAALVAAVALLASAAAVIFGVDASGSDQDSGSNSNRPPYTRVVVVPERPEQSDADQDVIEPAAKPASPAATAPSRSRRDCVDFAGSYVPMEPTTGQRPAINLALIATACQRASIPAGVTRVELGDACSAVETGIDDDLADGRLPQDIEREFRAAGVAPATIAEIKASGRLGRVVATAWVACLDSKGFTELRRAA